MKRRDLMKAAAMAVPLGSLAQAPGWRPLLLDDHQNLTVIALTDLIIPETDTPGAKAANVNRYIDLFLRDGDIGERERFLAGLNWLDGYALRSYSHPFVACAAGQQIAMLTALDRGTDPEVRPGMQFFRQ